MPLPCAVARRVTCATPRAHPVPRPLHPSSAASCRPLFRLVLFFVDALLIPPYLLTSMCSEPSAPILARRAWAQVLPPRHPAHRPPLGAGAPGLSFVCWRPNPGPGVTSSSHHPSQLSVSSRGVFPATEAPSPQAFPGLSPSLWTCVPVSDALLIRLFCCF